MKSRSAYTLIELSVTMTAGSSLIILAVGMLHQSMSLASAARARSDHHRTLNRLAQQFRSDAHQAAKCVVTTSNALQFLMPDDSEITYEIGGNRITRHQPRGDQIAHREWFQCGAGCTPQFELRSQPDRAALTVIVRPHPAIDQSRVDREIVAVIGRRLAHENAEVTR